MNQTTPLFALALVGATGSGKTALSLPLAEAFGCEILSCDSMQIYRGMDIGTAKATAAEQARVPHHLLDLVEPSAPFSAADYGDAALQVARQVTARGHLPMLVGGTGLYLEAARTGRHGAPIAADPDFRSQMLQLAEAEGKEALHTRLCAIDPASAAGIPPGNVRRVIRALEIHRQTGKTKTQLDEESRSIPPQMELCVLYLYWEQRELLYRRTDARVDEMLRQGLPEEVQRLRNAGLLRPNTTAGQAIGYKELLSHLEGKCTLQEAAEAIKLATRHYVKRQQTWFSAMPHAHRLQMDQNGALRPLPQLLQEAKNLFDANISLHFQ